MLLFSKTNRTYFWIDFQDGFYLQFCFYPFDFFFSFNRKEEYLGNRWMSILGKWVETDYGVSIYELVNFAYPFLHFYVKLRDSLLFLHRAW